MYGVIPIANSVAFEKAPPESVFKYASIFVLVSLLEEISFNLALHRRCARLGCTAGQAELDLNRALVLGRQEARRKPDEQHAEERHDHDVDAERQDATAEDRAHRASVGVGHAIEIGVEAL